MISARPLLPWCVMAGLLSATACVGSRTAPATPAPVHTAAPKLVAVEDLGEGPEIVEAEPPAPAYGILGTAAYDLPIEANDWVEAELEFLVEERSEVIARWLDRGSYYADFVRSTLTSYGLPTDLFHIAMIESGFVPTARSHAGAVGMWQFMAGTVRHLGLRVDGQVDERRDPVRSTRAAARHLRSLFELQGDWALAAAAYNAGNGRISRGLERVGVDDFWQLAVWGDLAEETKHYVPRLYAATIIGRNRERFGFAEPVPERTQFAFDSIRVEYATPLSVLASMGDVSVEKLSELNPHLLRGITPSGGYWVWVPPGTGEALQTAYLASDFRKHKGLGVYVVRSGDNLSMLAYRSGIRASRIRELNPRVNWKVLPIGTRLSLPFTAAETLTEARESRDEGRIASATSGQEVSSAGTATSASEHVVDSGETLWGIARQYSVGVSAIQEANGLSGATIRPGDRLRIPGGTGQSQLASAEESGADSVRHVVRTGETLWGIARSYGSSVDAIREANVLDRSVIRPGQTLLIPR